MFVKCVLSLLSSGRSSGSERSLISAPPEPSRPARPGPAISRILSRGSGVAASKRARSSQSQRAAAALVSELPTTSIAPHAPFSLPVGSLSHRNAAPSTE